MSFLSQIINDGMMTTGSSESEFANETVVAVMAN